MAIFHLGAIFDASEGNGLTFTAELQKIGILVPRIPDISGRKSGHFKVVAINISIFCLKRMKKP